MTRPTPEMLRSSFPALSKAPDATIDAIIAAGSVSHVPAGSSVYMEGQECGGIGLITEGVARVFKMSESGREITLYEVEGGSTCILSASCIMAGGTYPAYATALTDITMIGVSAADWRKLMHDHPKVQEFVFRLLAERLGSVIQLIEEVTFGRMDERITDYLIERSENGRLVTTHQAIAGDLGTSREVVSRILKDMERKGQLTLKRGAIEGIGG